MRPLVSVIIAAYRPGDAFSRVIDSLDAQTLPQEAFETIVVDDGSPDDTFERLTALAATRPNLRVDRIENSGWPSRPRNLGIGMARGEYVLFMDHDDSLYPDALRRMTQYAAETRADLLSPKESKTSDAWWGISALAEGNIPDARSAGGIEALLPMVPHKLYRRSFLQQHGIAFPEGRRQLWEDIYVNVAAWRHAQRVAVLADTPVYLWHSSATNNSKSYGPLTEEFWDRLDELFAFIDTTLDGADFADARRDALLHQYRGRVLQRLSRHIGRASAEEAAMAVGRARAIQQRYVPEEWDADLASHVRARAILLRAGRPDLLAELGKAEADTAVRVTATALSWRDGRLHITVEAQWRHRGGGPVGLVRDGDRLCRDLPPEVRSALPVEVVDLSGSLPCFRLDLAVRDRSASVSWQLPVEQEAHWADLDDDRVTPRVTGTAVLDPALAAGGSPIAVSLHDLVAKLRWDGASRAGSVRYSGRAAPAVFGGGSAVAYRSRRQTLALDTSGALRNVVADGGVAAGRVPGGAVALRLPLPKVAASGRAELPAAVRLTRTDRPAAEVVLQGAVVADAGGARLEFGPTGRLRSGDYTLAFQVGNGAFLGPRPARLARGALTILPKNPPAPPPHPLARALPPLVARALGAVRRRIAG